MLNRLTGGSVAHLKIAHLGLSAIGASPGAVVKDGAAALSMIVEDSGFSSSAFLTLRKIQIGSRSDD